MAVAYTPGLMVKERMILRKERRLPLQGEVLVKQGQRVKHDTIVARTDLPGAVYPLNVANQLKILPGDISSYMTKQVGESAKKGDVVAETKGIFGLFKSYAHAPCDGTIENISSVTGQVLFREPPIPVQIDAFIDGTVKEILPKEGVVIESPCSFIQGIFGIGGEACGEVMVLTEDRTQELTASMITADCKGKVIVGGSFIDYQAITKAIEVGAVGVVVGGLDDKTLRDFLGYDLGVAITGREDKGITLILTEGFGRIDMAKATFELLSKKQGQLASINGATQIRAGVIRPVIVIPAEQDGDFPESVETESAGMQVGSMVRIIRQPYFGYVGEVIELPPELTVLESESKARVVKLRLEDGTEHLLPRANVELIETM